MNVRDVPSARHAQLREHHGRGADGAAARARRTRKSRAPSTTFPPASSIAWSLCASCAASPITTIRKPPTWTRRSRPSTRLTGGLWIILGGKDKDSDYTVLREPLQREGARGAADRRRRAQDRSAAWTARCRSLHCGTLGAAVDQAARSADAGRYGAAGAGLRQLRSVREFRTSRPRIQANLVNAFDGGRPVMAQRLKTDWILFSDHCRDGVLRPGDGLQRVVGDRAAESALSTSQPLLRRAPAGLGGRFVPRADVLQAPGLSHAAKRRPGLSDRWASCCSC